MVKFGQQEHPWSPRKTFLRSKKSSGERLLTVRQVGMEKTIHFEKTIYLDRNWPHLCIWTTLYLVTKSQDSDFTIFDSRGNIVWEHGACAPAFAHKTCISNAKRSFMSDLYPRNLLLLPVNFLNGSEPLVPFLKLMVLWRSCLNNAFVSVIKPKSGALTTLCHIIATYF